MSSRRADFRETFLAEAEKVGIVDERYYDLVFDTCEHLLTVDQAVPLLRVSGAQGSGKSTVAQFLALVLDNCFDKKAAVLSLDDFYLTRQARIDLSEAVHPLLRVRGVPGTHDTDLMLSVIKKLQSGQSAEAPRFEKADDDRSPEVQQLGPVDVVITEGWCLGAKPQARQLLAEPCNTLERTKDKDCLWREFLNDQLETRYPPIFECDLSLFLAVPSFDAVFRWRLQQEQRLAEERSGVALLDEEGVRAFIAHYERVTWQMLKDLPIEADIVAYLNERHEIAGVTHNSRPQ